MCVLGTEFDAHKEAAVHQQEILETNLHLLFDIKNQEFC